MNKSDLIDRVAGEAGVEKRQAEGVLDAFFNVVTSSVKGGDKVAWPGFGSFSASKRAARTGRNPRTGAAVKIPASTAMKFTASSTLKSAMNAKAAGGKKAAPKKASAKKAPAKKASKSTKKR